MRQNISSILSMIHHTCNHIAMLCELKTDTHSIVPHSYVILCIPNSIIYSYVPQ